LFGTALAPQSAPPAAPPSGQGQGRAGDDFLDLSTPRAYAAAPQAQGGQQRQGGGKFDDLADLTTLDFNQRRTHQLRVDPISLEGRDKHSAGVE
jgi:hypothetical protein